MRSKKVELIWRYGIVSALISLFAMLIIASLVKTTIVNADRWNAKADSILNRVLLVKPLRGDILACDGTVLATNLTAYDISIDYSTLNRHCREFAVRVDSLCDSMALYYPQRNREEWKEYLCRPLDVDSVEKLKKYHLVLKNASYADYERICSFPFFRDYKKRYGHGLVANPKEIRVTPYGNMACLSIGRCNYQQAPKFEGASRRRDFVDVLHGYSGLEYALDSLLYGKDGTAHYEQLTRSMNKWVDQPAQDGLTLLTTIDINMQDIVETELMDMLQRSQAEWGTCLLMEVATGDIKAISNLERDKNTGRYIEARNYSVMPFEPGSVMKPISMVVALEKGYADLSKEYPIGSVYAYGGGPAIHDTHSPATLPVSRFIEYSSNIGMTKLIAPHYESNLNQFREDLRGIGLLDTLHTYLHGETRPRIPTLNPKAGGKVSLSRMTYGYSTMIPPLYTCAMYNAIANDGRYVRPRIVKQFISRDGSVRENPVSYVRDQMCSPQNAAYLREMIHSVVWGQGGTAKTLRNDYVDIAGKTGTCLVANELSVEERGDSVARARHTGGYIQGKYRLAFCGFFPYDKPLYTCMVLICSPEDKTYNSAAGSSGTVLKNVALKMYARGMLGRHSDYTAETHPGTAPVMYADSPENTTLAQRYTGAGVQHFKMPATAEHGRVPDVRGMGLRQAVARLEEAGYTVAISGSGYAESLTPPPGTALQPGKNVKVQFTTRPAKQKSN